ncbi:MAG TPA: hypothetical protein VEQ11_04520 [Chloroflexota bacterium]|nr:hypothetical protein [Chloroflexota bacterium]
MNSTASASITRHLEVEALQEAVRWPNAETRTVAVLAGQLLASRRDEEGYAYFRERAEARPDQPLFLALEGLFQARLAGHVSLIRRRARVNEAIAKLDQAVSRAPGLTTYFRGLVLAELRFLAEGPSGGHRPRMGARQQGALSDWVQKERLPLPRQGVPHPGT